MVTLSEMMMFASGSDCRLIPATEVTIVDSRWHPEPATHRDVGGAVTANSVEGKAFDRAFKDGRDASIPCTGSARQRTPFSGQVTLRWTGVGRHHPSVH